MRNTLLITLSLLISAAASAAQFRDFYVIPVAAHAAGANGTSWRTDVSLFNIQPDPVTVTFAVVESGEGLLDNVFPVAVGTAGASSVTVPAGGSMILADVLKDHRGRAETSGALLIEGDKPFAVTSRTYNVTANGTVGQTVAPATDIAAETSDDTSTLFIPGLVSNGSFRTNLGLLMTASTPMTVTVLVDGADGGSLGTRTFNVAPGMSTQVQFPVTSFAPAPFNAAGAIVRITGGAGSLVAYASLVDNRTGDASFIPGGMMASGGGASLRAVLERAGER